MDKARDSSNALLPKIKAAVGPSIPFVHLFKEISKNQGILLFYFCHWTRPKPNYNYFITVSSWVDLGHLLLTFKQLVSVLGIDGSAKPVQIIYKSVKDMKQKSFPFQEFDTSIELIEIFENMKNVKTEFHYNNIIPIPNILTKVFISLRLTGPYFVAKAFFEQIKDPYTSSQIPPNDHLQTVMETSEDSVADQDSDEIQSPPEKDDSDSAINERPIIMGKTFSRPLLEFIYVIQFRHLCLKAKIPLVLYTFPSSPEIQTLFALITPDAVPFPKHALSRRMVSSNCSDSESDEVSSPERKISKKDYYLINTMMKLHESMDRSSLKQTLKREEKEG